MIYRETNEVEGMFYDSKVTLSDWRYSAVVVGLIRYFDYHNISYHINKRELLYNLKDVDNRSDELYFAFAEHYFKEHMPHYFIEETLKNVKHDDVETIKKIREKISGSKPLRELFGHLKNDDILENKQDILEEIEEHRQELVEHAMRYSPFCYSKFCQQSVMRKPESRSKVCRIIGYYVETRKVNSVGWHFNDKAVAKNDTIEFDFVPFAFAGKYDSLFVNANLSIDALLKCNEQAKTFCNSNKLIVDMFVGQGIPMIYNNEIEIIIKPLESKGVEGVQLRKTANNIFTRVNKMLADKDVELFNIMIPTNKGPQNIKLVIFEHIAHGWLLDGIIEVLLQASLKSTVRLEFITYILININQIMYEEMGMYSKNTF